MLNSIALLAALLQAAVLSDDGGTQGAVRLQASVVVASTDGREIATTLRPLQRRLRNLFPYTSYRSFTEYTAAIAPGTALELRLPDGRTASLRPEAGPSSAAAAKPTARTIHVAIDGGEDFESEVVCDDVTVFQVRSRSGPKNDRTFLVYAETCPGEHPRRMLAPEK